MQKQNRIDCSKIEKGFEFPDSECDLNTDWIAGYLEATGEESEEYARAQIVPPMAVATCAMSSLANMIDLPPGSIHISQSFDFLESLRMGDHIVCRSKVT